MSELIAILSPYPDEILPVLRKAGNGIIVCGDTLPNTFDFLVVYGHRHIIGEPYLSAHPGQIINLHLSYLPWNRGADPNLWSFIDDTPKGVSIHVIDAGLDTGPVLAKREVILSGTLKTSYNQLRRAMVHLFADEWPAIRAGKKPPRWPIAPKGSYHCKDDKWALWSRLSRGFDTPIEEVEALGRQLRQERRNKK
jgi:hypothetical protein